MGGPLALRTSDPLGVPAVFAVATPLPVIAKVRSAQKAAEKFEYWTRCVVGVLFIGIRDIFLWQCCSGEVE
ncbi:MULTISPECIES: hypothetical protein [unclassified Methanoculleus]|uniref:hypothetical protein n=1 Tax=unclassified Methanoculleus TaxID=2619537 RepID=UPI0025EAEE90|nr:MULTISPECIES: hypothetical protein [unclassified Methanoculleus]MCK9317022.1 hypothetical protein [Methanoculleus sp.]MDD2252897.1 hypothetical protein [Methanoculleus sp.]MDD2787613.1 hypothetical protein [Methanoculleus sp.]MDD3215686.1 hypothetical protein [Methanoculleus sp.]MDD4313555.1 hypothetical protein [Methanoculleus sp.]